MDKYWQTLSSGVVHQNPWFSILEDDFIRPDGSEGKYFVMKRKPGVAIIPFDGHKIHLVNQFRYALKKRTWELPVGTMEDDNHLEQGKKELKEETGITASQWTFLGSFAAAPGYSDGLGFVYLAEGLTFGKPQREAGEQDMLTKSFTLEEIDHMVEKGEMIDAWTIIPLYYYKLYLAKK